ncbi:MAG: DUF3579 domain-containing protein [Burkholderiaceae bacterium]
MDAVVDVHDRAARPAPCGAVGPAPPLPRLVPAAQAKLAVPSLRELLIVGMTVQGKVFRPSDWSERLAGAMSAFRPAGSPAGIASFIGYSPHCVPRTVQGHKCVLVNEALRGIEAMAWDFVMNFARDNQLEVRDVTPVARQALQP